MGTPLISSTDTCDSLQNWQKRQNKSGQTHKKIHLQPTLQLFWSQNVSMCIQYIFIPRKTSTSFIAARKIRTLDIKRCVCAVLCLKNPQIRPALRTVALTYFPCADSESKRPFVTWREDLLVRTWREYSHWTRKGLLGIMSHYCLKNLFQAYLCLIFFGKSFFDPISAWFSLENLFPVDLRFIFFENLFWAHLCLIFFLNLFWADLCLIFFEESFLSRSLSDFLWRIFFEPIFVGFSLKNLFWADLCRIFFEESFLSRSLSDLPWRIFFEPIFVGFSLKNLFWADLCRIFF